MTVYLAHELESPKLRDSIRPAAKFGEIRCANRFYIHGDELEQVGTDNFIPSGYRVNMERVASEFNPDQDFLLIVGDHLQVLALACILVTRHGYVTVLRWDRLMGEYIPVRLGSASQSRAGGIVSPPAPVLVSDTIDHIGENDHGESRSQEDRAREDSLELPLHRFGRGYNTKRPPQDDS